MGKSLQMILIIIASLSIGALLAAALASYYNSNFTKDVMLGLGVFNSLLLGYSIYSIGKTKKSK